MSRVAVNPEADLRNCLVAQMTAELRIRRNILTERQVHRYKPAAVSGDYSIDYGNPDVRISSPDDGVVAASEVPIVASTPQGIRWGGASWLLFGTDFLEPDIRSSSRHVRARDFWVYRVRLPLTAGCLLTGLTVTMLAPPWMPQGGTLDVWLSLMAVAFLGFGIAWRLWSIACIHSRKTSSLVETGPYSLCRNPLYLGTFSLMLGYLCIWKSITLMLMAVPVLLWYIRGVVPIEERIMLDRHGLAFRKYCARVPRWFPIWTGYIHEPILRINNAGFCRELQCCLWWLLIALLMQMVYNARLLPHFVTPLQLL